MQTNGKRICKLHTTKGLLHPPVLDPLSLSQTANTNCVHGTQGGHQIAVHVISIALLYHYVYHFCTLSALYHCMRMNFTIVRRCSLSPSETLPSLSYAETRNAFVDIVLIKGRTVDWLNAPLQRTRIDVADEIEKQPENRSRSLSAVVNTVFVYRQCTGASWRFQRTVSMKWKPPPSLSLSLCYCCCYSRLHKRQI